MEEIIEYGAWASFTGVVNEPNLHVNSITRKAARAADWRTDPATKAKTRGVYTDPTLTFTLDCEVITKAGLATLGIGNSVSAGLANFDAVWRDHDPDDGVLILDDADDKSDAASREPLTTTLTIVHRPFVVVA